MSDPQVRRIFGIPVHLHHGAVLSLARQIVESTGRSDAAEDIKPGKDSAGFPRGSGSFASSETSEQVAETSAIASSGPAKQAPQKPVAVPKIGDQAAGSSNHCNGPTTVAAEAGTVEPVSTEEPVKDAVTAPAIGTAREPSVSSRRTAVVAFLREALAKGPVAASEVERRAVDAGLLGQAEQLGKSKVFRTARASLGVMTRQRPGRRAAGWTWSLDPRDPPSPTGGDS